MKQITIYELNKILSSENKSKILAHFWDCFCQHNHVAFIEEKLALSQSNLSKHISSLAQKGLLDSTKRGKEKFYSINPHFKQKYFEIVNPQMNLKENRIYKCNCSFS